jgi:hypothetical protein
MLQILNCKVFCLRDSTIGLGPGHLSIPFMPSNPTAKETEANIDANINFIEIYQFWQHIC